MRGDGVNLVTRKLHHCARTFQLPERFYSPPLCRQLDRVAVFRAALPPNLCQLAGLQAGVMLQNPQCIATDNGQVATTQHKSAQW